MKCLLFSSEKLRPTTKLKVVLAGWSVLLLVLATAALMHAAALDERCVTDDLGRRVCNSGMTKRVVSLAPNLTETIFALGAENLLVGRTTRCNRPPEALAIHEVGGYLNPDLERIVALAPDLVCASKAGLRDELVIRLAALGMPVFVDDSKSLDDICELVTRLGILLGHEADASNLVRGFQERRQTIRNRLQAVERPSVLFAVGVRPLVVAGGKSFLGALVREAGGTNIAETENIPFPRLSFEEVIRKDPDFILVLDKECREEECLNYLRRYSGLRAVNHSRVFSMDADLMARPGPRIIEALEILANIFHPGLLGVEHQ